MASLRRLFQGRRQEWQKERNKGNGKRRWRGRGGGDPKKVGEEEWERRMNVNAVD